MKLVHIFISTSLLSAVLTSSAFAAPSTTGKISVGGQTQMSSLESLGSLSSAGGSSASTLSSLGSLTGGSFINLTYTLNDSMRLKGLLGLNMNNLSVETESGDTKTTQTASSLNFGLGAEFDYFFAKMDKARAYVGLGLGLFNLGSLSSKSGDTTTSTESPMVIGISPSLGVEYFLTSNFSLEGAIGLPISFASRKTNNTSASLMSLGFDFNPMLAMNYYF